MIVNASGILIFDKVIVGLFFASSVLKVACATLLKLTTLLLEPNVSTAVFASD